MKVRNTFIIFIVSGFWHGANWTFIVWGALNAIYFLPLLLAKKNRQNMEIVAKDKWFPGAKDLLRMASTFILTLIAWVFFRARDIQHAIDYLSEVFSASLFTGLAFKGEENLSSMVYVLLFFTLIEWLGRDQEHAIAKLGNNFKRPVRWAIYYVILLLMFYMRGAQQEFIYFQF